ncbi:MAG: C-GCAxxG-C-C family protein [Proteobacteria bacterium]|nr:hypothetical protein [Desulfobulbaceae bacterium]MBU4153176.1 C-GCAxxG-C-C family protein [Pseudomonadota bacterium]MDP2104993.1 C-GCAxxG-C-C family (seleno)protein [Desulfobulbaceae bacterium]
MAQVPVSTDVLTRAIRQRVENYYDAHGLCCSEAILFVINKGLGGGLNDDMVRQLGAGFCGGMGGGEGVCGALAGAVAALGLILGPGRRHGLTKSKMRLASKQLHDSFLEALRSTSCFDLSAPYAGEPKARMKNCKSITGLGAELCAKTIFSFRPKVALSADIEFLNRNDSKAQAVMQKIGAFF